MNKSKSKKNKRKIKSNRRVRAPVAKGGVSTTVNKSMTVSHREYVATVQGHVTSFATSLASYRINPGDSTTFPWLAGIARNFESYQFESLVFEYVPSVAATQAGNIFLAIDYDPADTEPATENQMMTYDGAKMTNLWNPVRLPSRKQNLRKRKTYFVRNPADTLLTDAYDYRQSDVGNLFVAAVGVTSATGRLFVSYKVRFVTPQVARTIPFGAGYFPNADGVSLTEQLGTNASGGDVNEASNVTILRDTANSFHISDPGKYVLQYMLNGVGVTDPGELSTDAPNEVSRLTDAHANTAESDTLRSYLVEVFDVLTPFDLGNATGTSASQLDWMLSGVGDHIDISSFSDWLN